MSSEKFCLRWNDFERNISGAFQELRTDKDFFDVSLVCEDEQIQAHKVILSACSTFFRNILRQNPHPHPLIYLKGVTFPDLQSVLNFMYHGEVNIAQEELNSFLSVAEDLRVKGLTQSQSVPVTDKKIETYKHKKERDNVVEPQNIKERSKMNAIHTHTHHENTAQEDYDIHTVARKEQQQSIKSEPKDPSLTYNTVQDTMEYSVATYQGVGYEDYSQYDVQAQEQYSADDEDVDVRTPEDLLKFVLPGDSGFVCFYCSKVFPNKRDVRNHLESIHFPNYFTYCCELCGKEFKSLNSRNIHMTRNHNKTKKVSGL